MTDQPQLYLTLKVMLSLFLKSHNGALDHQAEPQPVLELVAVPTVVPADLIRVRVAYVQGGRPDSEFGTQGLAISAAADETPPEELPVSSLWFSMNSEFGLKMNCSPVSSARPRSSCGLHSARTSQIGMIVVSNSTSEKPRRSSVGFIWSMIRKKSFSPQETICLPTRNRNVPSRASKSRGTP